MCILETHAQKSRWLHCQYYIDLQIHPNGLFKSCTMLANKSKHLDVMLDAILMNTERKNIPKAASTSYRDNNMTNFYKMFCCVLSSACPKRQLLEPFQFTKAIMLEVLQMVTGPVRRETGKFYYSFLWFGSISIILLLCGSEIIRSQLQSRTGDLRMLIHEWSLVLCMF